MVDPAPKVEAARASPVNASAAQASAVKASNVGEISPAPSVEAAVADPPTEDGTLNEINNIGESTAANQSLKKMSVETLRSTKQVTFESPAAIIIGPAEKNIFQRLLPLCFDERAFLSYGEGKRYIIITEGCIFSYTDIGAFAPLYTIALSQLTPTREDPDHPDFYSHTISPEVSPPSLLHSVCPFHSDGLIFYLLFVGQHWLAVCE